MATAKNKKTVKPKKEVIRTVQNNGSEIKEETKLTAEEKIFGAEVEAVTKKIIDYESPERKYKVTNLQIKNNPVTVNGRQIETFIGSINKEARAELKGGAKSVITIDDNGKKAYKIEVVE